MVSGHLETRSVGAAFGWLDAHPRQRNGRDRARPSNTSIWLLPQAALGFGKVAERSAGRCMT